MAQEKQRRTFISYSRIDQEFALKLARELKSVGFPVWLDQLDIPTGARWDDEVEKALHDCGIFMAILTPASIASENAKDEFGYAIDHGKRILPILLADCEIPFRLRRFQYVDFTTMNFGQGVKNAKDLLAKMMKEDSIPVLARDSNIGDATPVEVKERPTRPSKIGSEWSKPAPRETAGISPPHISKKKLVKRLSIIFAGLLIVTVIVFWRQILSSPRGTPATPTEELKPSETPTPTGISHIPSPTTTLIPQFFTEEFDNDSEWNSQWSLSEFSHGNFDKFGSTVENGELKWELADPYLWIYYHFMPFEFTNVRLEVDFKNLSSFDDAYMSMICRHNDMGWYEFNTYGGGLYKISEMDTAGWVKKTWEGGLQRFNFGPDNVNKMTAVCNGRELSISINDGKARTILLGNDDNLGEGRIGIAISAHKNWPVRVQIDSIQISEP